MDDSDDNPENPADPVPLDTAGQIPTTPEMIRARARLFAEFARIAQEQRNFPEMFRNARRSRSPRTTVESEIRFALSRMLNGGFQEAASAWARLRNIPRKGDE